MKAAILVRHLWMSIALCPGLLWTSAAAAQQKNPVPIRTVLPRSQLHQHPLWDYQLCNHGLNASLVLGRVKVEQLCPFEQPVIPPGELYTVDWKDHRRTDCYEQTTKDARFFVKCVSDGRLIVRRDSNKKSPAPSVEYLQISDEPVSFSLGDGGARKVYQAPSLWHLAVARPKECRQHLFPLLASFFPDCRWLLIESASVEQTLLSEAAGGGIVSRQRLMELVQQLGDDHFAKREAADRQLRALGAWASGPLGQLDCRELDAEQQFRIQRILDMPLALRAGPNGMDLRFDPQVARHIAMRLAADPATWLLLLERPEESIRRTAARQLTGLLGEPIAVDPAAEPETQKSQREHLRAKFESPKRDRDGHP